MNIYALAFVLALAAAPAFAEPSGYDCQKIADKLTTACDELDGRLDQADTAFDLLLSTPLVTAEDYAALNGDLDDIKEGLKELDIFTETLSGAVEKLEKRDPRPDDLQDLQDLKTAADKRTAEIKARYVQAGRQMVRLAKKMEEQTKAPGQAGAAYADPEAAEKEKQEQLKLAESARAMGDKEKEFAAIQHLSAIDPQRGGQMLTSFFDGLSPQERGSFDKRAQAGPAYKAPGTGGQPAAANAVSHPAQKPLSSSVPGIGISPKQKDGAPAADAQDAKPGAGKPAVTANDFKLSLWTAADRFAPTVAVPHLREAKLGLAADAKTDWLNKKRQEFLEQAAKAKDPAEKQRYAAAAVNIDGLLGSRGAAAAAGSTELRAGKLGEWNANVSRLMDKSAEGKAEKDLIGKKAALDAEFALLKTDAEREAWAKKRGQEYEGCDRQLAEFYVKNPEYLQVRKTEAETQSFLQARLPDFQDGTKFSANELGLKLPPDRQVTIKRVPGGGPAGARGFSYADEKGLSHFQSFDDTVRVNEIMTPAGELRSVEVRLAKDGTLNEVERGPGGKLLRTEERKPDGSVASEIYGPDGKAAASVLLRPDGSRTEAEILPKEGVKRTVYTDPKGGQTFSFETLAGKDGYPKQSGRIVDGRPVIDKWEPAPGTVKARTGDYVFETKVNGRSAGFEVDLASIQGLPENKRAGAAKASALIMAGGSAPRAGPLTQFITQVSRQARPGDQMSIQTGRDDKGGTVYQADILSADGTHKQVLGQWNKLSKAESAGLPSDVGLDISVRSVGKTEDINQRQYLKLFRYSGENVTDRYSAESRTTGNWFTGYGAVSDNYIYRMSSDNKTLIAKIPTGTDTLYSSPNILGQTGIAIGTMGKGAVQLTGSAISLAGAGTYGWFDKHAQDEFMLRAKANFYGNDVTRSLGRDYIGKIYEEGYADLGVKEDRNIQNVGKEMASMGRPTLGAVLQGGVNYSNGVATNLIMAPLGGSALSKVAEKAGTVGTVASKTYSTYKAGEAVYKTGASGVELVQAGRAFYENDPKSKERYYAAITGFTEKALNAPKTVSGVYKAADNIKNAKDALTYNPKVLGPDGRPYVHEQSDFKKFMLGKNEPGALTRTMTKDITGGLDPKLNIGIPAPGFVKTMDKWVADKVSQVSGNPVPVPRPGLILPDQPKPGKVIVPGQPEPRPDAKVITDLRQNPPAALPKDGKLWTPGQTESRPDAKIITGNEPKANPDAKIIISDH